MTAQDSLGRQFDSLEVNGNVAQSVRGDYHVMVLNSGGRSTAYASHRPRSDPDAYSTVGEARFHEDGTLDNIGVSSAHQRKGVGTQVWHTAQELAKSGGMAHPQHAVERTDAGDSWAKKVGGPRPTQKKVYRS